MRDKREEHSPWYRSAGAVTTLAAIFFLERLSRYRDSTGLTVHLVEGFATRREGESGNHKEVARRLVAAYDSTSSLMQWKGQLMYPLVPFMVSAPHRAPGVLALGLQEREGTEILQ
ncbi:hypothetical protein DES53_103212 [Roseimicrobium gellanilyticum]|uniref:Uncharacterized protein n=2 Tax=Roseimicrobium gellanilyticum TaxID=748857 RepID=A0A366HQ23_9BACT|nr:hypothetical protein DES53_103212 [Roseimicrobium gellanilyticum]